MTIDLKSRNPTYADAAKVEAAVDEVFQRIGTLENKPEFTTTPPLSLRDYVATQVLTALVANNPTRPPPEYANEAYRIADALLAVRG